VVRLEARVVATVNADYDANVDDGDLRRDLLSHLQILRLNVPPLRDYSEDVPELLSYYVDKLVDSEGLTFRRFSVAAQNRLRNYPWPDNVRELKNLVRRLLLTGSDDDISLGEVESEISSSAHAAEPLVKQDLLALPLREAREQFERAYLQQQLVLCDGKVGQLAKRVGMERTHLYRKLRSLGVDFKSFGRRLSRRSPPHNEKRMDASVLTPSTFSLALAFLPALIVIVIMYYWRAGGGTAIYATLRMLVQLLLIGYVLIYIFDADHWGTIIAVLVAMLIAASWIAVRTVKSPGPRTYIIALIQAWSRHGATAPQ